MQFVGVGNCDPDHFIGRDWTPGAIVRPYVRDSPAQGWARAAVISGVQACGGMVWAVDTAGKQ